MYSVYDVYSTDSIHRVTQSVKSEVWPAAVATAVPQTISLIFLFPCIFTTFDFFHNHLHLWSVRTCHHTVEHYLTLVSNLCLRILCCLPPPSNSSQFSTRYLIPLHKLPTLSNLSFRLLPHFVSPHLTFHWPPLTIHVYRFLVSHFTLFPPCVCPDRCKRSDHSPSVCISEEATSRGDRGRVGDK